MRPLALISVLLLAGCGYDGSYRYPCQDPVNWDTPECTPPICHAADYCTKDLIPTEALSK